MDKLLTERFIMTLNIILRGASNILHVKYIKKKIFSDIFILANTFEKPEIVKEYFELAFSMRYSNITLGVKRAIILGFDTIVNICYSDQEDALFHDFPAELVTTRDWLQGRQKKKKKKKKTIHMTMKIY
jgi:hypothetical protein